MVRGGHFDDEFMFSRDDEEDDLDAKRVVFAPLKRAAATAAAAFNGGGTARVRIKDVMVVGVQNVLCSSRR